jgi:hypothetical protein
VPAEALFDSKTVWEIGCRRRNEMGRKYIFTNKKESRKGIMSTVLGAVSLFSLFLAVYGTFQNQGEALVKYGMGVLFALLFALTGIVLGIMSKMEEDKFYLFSYLGILLNVLAIAGVGFILYAGVYGL